MKEVIFEVPDDAIVGSLTLIMRNKDYKERMKNGQYDDNYTIHTVTFDIEEGTRYFVDVENTKDYYIRSIE